MNKATVRVAARLRPRRTGDELLAAMLGEPRAAREDSDGEPWPRSDGYWPIVDGGEPPDAIRARVGRRAAGVGAGCRGGGNRTGGR